MVVVIKKMTVAVLACFLSHFSLRIENLDIEVNVDDRLRPPEVDDDNDDNDLDFFDGCCFGSGSRPSPSSRSKSDS